MKRILALAAALLALGAPLATAQQAVVTSPTPRVTTNASGTIASTNVFQQIWPAQTNRVNCGIQNNDTNTMWAFFGSGTPTKATSVVLAPGQFLNCSTSGVVATSAVWITGTATGVFYAGLDGAPIVAAPTTVVATSSGTGNVNLVQVGSTNVVTGGVAGTLGIGGLSAASVADSGNPVKVGCVFTGSTLPTYTAGNRTDCQSDSRGNIRVYPALGTLAGADAFSNSSLGYAQGTASTSSTLLQGTAPWYFNGSSWDRTRGDVNGAWAQGNVASGVADAGNPVKVGCVFNSTLPTIANAQRGDCQIDARGNLRTLAVGSLTVGVDGFSNGNLMTWDRSNIPGTQLMQQNAAYKFNGASWDRDFTCSNSAIVNVTAGATTQIVALAASQVIRVCSVSISMSAAGTAQFVYGTGANCGTGTTNITGAMPLATGTPMAISSGNGSVMRTASANALCVAAVTGNVVGWVTYAQY